MLAKIVRHTQADFSPSISQRSTFDAGSCCQKTAVDIGTGNWKRVSRTVLAWTILSRIVFETSQDSVASNKTWPFTPDLRSLASFMAVCTASPGTPRLLREQRPCYGEFLVLSLCPHLFWFCYSTAGNNRRLYHFKTGLIPWRISGNLWVISWVYWLSSCCPRNGGITSALHGNHAREASALFGNYRRISQASHG